MIKLAIIALVVIASLLVFACVKVGADSERDLDEPGKE